VRVAFAPWWLLLALAAPGAAEEAPPAPPVAPEVAAVGPSLRHASWALRAVAAWDLRNRLEPGVAFLLAALLAGETDEVVLDCALATVASLPRENLVRDGGPALVTAVLGQAEHPNARVRARAWAALGRLAPVPLARSLEDYRGWWARGAEAHAREQRDLLRRAAEAAARPSPGTVPLAAGETKTVVAPIPETYKHVEGVVRDGLEVCVVIDDTGSMGAVIARAKASATTILRRLAAFVPRVRAGLVTYKDGASVSVALTTSEEAWWKAFRKVVASGGGDIEEGVDKGIRLALKQERMGWSRLGARVLIVVGDAPPHEEDVPGLLKAIHRAREDDLYERPVVVHTVSTDVGGVPHFDEIAAVGGGSAVNLAGTSRLIEEIVALAFGGALAARLRPWLEEVDLVRRQEVPR
jgi:Mg-chelatase subunit ChlD